MTANEEEWSKPISKNFDFGSSKIIFLDVTEVVSDGWEIAIKSQYINECDIQRPDIIRLEGKKRDQKRVDMRYTNVYYPPCMALEVQQVSSAASHLRISIIVKDGKDGNCVIPDSYVVALPKPTEKNTGNRNVLTKRSLSVEEEQCLEEKVSTRSLAKVSGYIQEWKCVAEKLSLSKVDIAHIEEECLQNNDPISERIFQMLNKWRRCSTCHTYKVLVDALKMCEEYEAVNYILGNVIELAKTRV